MGGGPGGNEPGPISTNGLLPAYLEGAHRVNLSALAQDLLSEANLGIYQLSAQAEYLIKCALGPGQSLNIGGIAYDGLVGLAPGWITKPLGDSEQRWISACLLAHANASGDSMRILLAGQRPELHALGGEGDFVFEEAAFYGNLFDASDTVPGGAVPPVLSQNLYACAGGGLSSNGAMAVHARICTDPLNCAIELPGSCVDRDTGWDLCDNGECYATGFLNGYPPQHPGFEEVIVIYLSSVDQCKYYGCN